MLFSSVMVRHWRCRSTTFATKRSWRWNLPVRSVSCVLYVIFVLPQKWQCTILLSQRNNEIILSAADLHCNRLQRVLPCSCCFQVSSKHPNSHLELSLTESMLFGRKFITFWQNTPTQGSGLWETSILHRYCHYAICQICENDCANSLWSKLYQCHI